MALPTNVKPGNLDLTIVQGANFSRTIQFKDSEGVVIDLTGVTIEAKIRREFSDAAALQAFTASVTDAANGVVVISLTAAETAALSLTGSSNQRAQSLGVWDLELTDTGRVERMLQGKVTLSQEATK